ncbi:hypothetical protein [Nocardioides sp. URHA0020]|uniref:hypothetical protein n=1 Tax=Nocardioides sp. URHA0020 TaxID=1380392 RepID=UPI000AE4C328|nr:hypothetical protein [Nocardioides sp. URHA0020]
MVLVPGVLALLPAYASLEDPVADLRAACLAAVTWLGPDPVVLADAQGARVAAALLAACTEPLVEAPGPLGPSLAATAEASYLVVGNGSARRTEKAPGHLDERAAAYDDALRAALTSGDGDLPDLEVGRSLLASLDGIDRLADLLPPGVGARVDYDDDPFGVQYWVLRWQW